MSSETIVSYFKDKKSSFANAFSGVQKNLERFTPLAEGRYDALAFECLCEKMDDFSKMKNEGVSFEDALKKVLPTSIDATYYNGSPSDSRIQPFYYLSSIIAVKHIYGGQDATKACGEKFTEAVQQMVKDRINYQDGSGGGPLRDCRDPEKTGEYLEDMQGAFNSELGETLRSAGLGPVIDVAEETIKCTDALAPHFEGMRTKEHEIDQERASLTNSLRALDKKEHLVRQEESVTVIESLDNFNPFADDLAQS